jgi:excisionase family DNA binding protein
LLASRSECAFDIVGSNTHDGDEPMMTQPRFLTLSDVAEVLNISASQTYALVRSGELQAIKIGGRGQWRVEREQLESYISRMYDQTKQFVAEHPFIDSATE